MKKTILALALGIGALGVSAAPAAAQTTTAHSVSARLGIFWPLDEDVRDFVGNTWIAAGIEYRFRDLPTRGIREGDRSSLSVSLDYMGRDDVSHVPILLNYVGRRDQFYYTAGLGIGFARVGNDESEARLAYSLGIGYDFHTSRARTGNPIFVEGRFWGSSESELNGFAAYIGVRF